MVVEQDFEWGELLTGVYKEPKRQDVLSICWQDHKEGGTFFITTAHEFNGGYNKIARQRKRPAGKAVNKKTVQRPFEQEDGSSYNYVKLIIIPILPDRYNHIMNGVDIHDQMRTYMDIQRRQYKG